MNQVLQWLDTDDHIRVDLDGLWQKAITEGRDASIRVQRGMKMGLSDILEDRTGELAIISAWASGKGKKG